MKNVAISKLVKHSSQLIKKNTLSAKTDLHYIIDRIIDKLFSFSSIDDKELKIAILAYNANGFGDFITGYKILNILRSNFPNSEIKLLLHHDPSDNTLYSKLSTIFNFQKEKDIFFQDLSNNDILFEPDFLIKASSIDLNFYLPKCLSYKKNPNCYSILEYDHPLSGESSVDFFNSEKKIKFYASGLSPWNMGLIFSKNLKKNNLKNKVYFGYINHLRPIKTLDFHEKTFFNTIIQLEKKSEKDIDIQFILGSSSINKNYDFLKDLYFENSNFSDLIIIYPDGSRKGYKLHAKDKKILTLHLHEQLDYQTTQSLIINSEDFICITGDQSLSETISLKKIFIYQVNPHKEYLFANLKTIAKRFPSIYSFFNLCDRNQKSHFLNLKNGYETLADIISKFRKNKRFEYFCDHLIENYDLEQSLVGKIKRSRIKLYSDKFYQNLKESIENALNNPKDLENLIKRLNKTS